MVLVGYSGVSLHSPAWAQQTKAMYKEAVCCVVTQANFKGDWGQI